MNHEENQSPRYGQIYIIDDLDTAVDYRNRRFTELDRDITDTITRVLTEINVHAQAFQMFQQEYLFEQEKEFPQELFLHFGIKQGTDIRRYNLRTSNEVAAVFATNSDGEIPDSYVTICDKFTKQLQFVNSLDPNVDPWIYPILFPHGTPGWNTKMFLENSRKLTRNAYTKYRLRILDNHFSPILNGGRLFQQYLVDSYLKIEKERIAYIIKNQKVIRSDKYVNVQQALNNIAANEHRIEIGKVIILPSTFIGSPRYMEENFQDSMAIVRKFGKPDLFLTMTCNQKWREITENLLPGQEPADRPDLVVRVFNQKVKFLLNIITKKAFFGVCTGWVYTIEFQKRGLPHIHLLITLASEYKLRNSDTIDKYISAELPDPNSYPQLREIVIKHMLHGPCSDRCIVNGKCSKKYPKTFQEETTIEIDRYPQYKRRNNND